MYIKEKGAGVVMSSGIGTDIPYVIGPDAVGCEANSPDGLVQWARENHEKFNDELTRRGALLFRGFGFSNVEEFNQFVEATSPNVLSYARGATPRKSVRGRIYTSTEANSRIPIPIHCEMSSYGKSVPSKISFYCETPSRVQGQTPIADMHALYEGLDPAVRGRFESRGLRMIQNVPLKLSRRKYPGASKTWPTMFETDDRNAVEEYCERQGIEYVWKPDGTIQLVNYIDAVIKHPKTGVKVWFNSAHNYYPSWSWEISRLNMPFLATLFKMNEWRQKRVFKDPVDMPNYVTFADGGEIARSDIECIRQAYWDTAVLFDWHKGDVMVLDNLRIAHGRMPYRGERRVLVALAEPWQKETPRCMAERSQATAGSSEGIGVVAGGR